MRSTWLLIAIGLLVAVISVGAIACDDDDDGNGDGAPTAVNGGAEPTVPTGGEEPTEAPVDGDDGDDAGAAGADVLVASHPEHGSILTDTDGLTLYTFAEDSANTSTCNEDCATAWPPLTVDAEPAAAEGVGGELGTIERDDGTTQVTLDGRPLYRYSGDSVPGETNGHGIGDVWFVATAP